MLDVSRRGAVSVWTLNRPEVKNALSYALLEAIAREAARTAQDATVRAVVITGAGGHFASGGDLRELRDRTTEQDAIDLVNAGIAALGALEALPVVVVAAIEGVAFGGGAELAVACDLRVASRSARISFKQARLGLTTAWGTFGRLTHMLGTARVARLLLLAEEIRTEEAHAMGLVDLVTDDGFCIEGALGWAERALDVSPNAILHIKTMLRAAHRGASDLDALERAHFTQAWTSPEHTEAVEAFFAKRPPPWTPRR